LRSRYDEIGIHIKDNKRYYNTILYSYISDSNADTIYTVREGDRLDLLAQKFYSDATLWWVIARRNLLGKGTLYLEPGKQIIIPAKSLQNFIWIDED
jgi:nucleoid-associated protein YgaU